MESYTVKIPLTQIADAVVVAKSLGATLVIPDIRGSKLGDKRLVVKSCNINHLLLFLLCCRHHNDGSFFLCVSVSQFSLLYLGTHKFGIECFILI